MFNRLRKLFISIRYFYLVFEIKRLKNRGFKNEECVILGNGPSLENSLNLDLDFIKSKAIFCVNGFPQTNYYEKIKPSFCILTDGIFWEKEYSDIFEDIENNRLEKYNNPDNRINLVVYKKMLEIRNNLFTSLEKKTNWRINLFVPIHSKSSKVFDKLSNKNNNIHVVYYSAIPINFSNSRLRHFFYNLNLGMPTPQTVIIAAIFLSIRLNFKKIFIVGVDQSWHEDMFLGNDNILYTKDKHFYDKGKEKHIPMLFNVRKSNRTIKIHEQFYALYVTFLAHVFLEKYSKSVELKIFNASRHTWVDAYERFNLDNQI